MGRFIFHFEHGNIHNLHLLEKKSLLSEIKSDFVHSVIAFNKLDKSNEIYEIINNQLRNKWKDCKLIDIFFLHYSEDMNSLRFVLIEIESEETNFNRNNKQYDVEFFKIIEEMKFFNIKRKFLFQIPINNEILTKLLWENKVNVEILNPFAINISRSQHVDILELLKSSIKESFKILPSFLSALVKKNEIQILPYYSTNHTVIKTKFTSNFDANLKILYRHSIRQYIFNFYYQFFHFSLHNFDGWLEKIFEIYTDYDISSLTIMKEYLENIDIKWIKQPKIWLEKLDKMVWSNHERTNTGKIKFDDETEQEMFFFNLLDFERYYTPIFEKIYLIEEKVKNSIQSIKQKMIISPKEVKLELSDKNLKDFLFNAKEDTLTKLFIVPLLSEMGFEQVRDKGHIEKINEYGQDINMMKYKLPTGHYLYFVCQIKTGNIGASHKQPTNDISGILIQIRQAVTKPIFDIEINKSVTPNHGFLITSGRIGEMAKKYLYDTLEKENSSILFIGIDELIESYFKFGIKNTYEKQILDFLSKNK